MTIPSGPLEKILIILKNIKLIFKWKFRKYRRNKKRNFKNKSKYNNFYRKI